MSRRQFEPLRHYLPGVLADAVEAGISARALAPLWADAVGPQIAAKSRPLSLNDGELLVEVADAAWLKELEPRCDALRVRLQARLGKKLTIRRLHFRAR